MSTTWGGRLEGQGAIVSGAASGIGRATAIRLAAEGSGVLLFDLNEKGLAETAEAIVKAGGHCQSLAGDVTNEADLATVTQRADKAFGRIDILVNVAGITATVKRNIEDTETSAADQIVDVNLMSVYNCVKHVIPFMKRRHYGRIVSVSSVAAFNPMLPGNAAYAMSKGGVTALTRALMVELSEHGITANCVAPGLIATQMVLNRGAEGVAKATRMIPMGRLGTPEDIASTIAFLALPESEYITGQMLIVDGGLTSTNRNQ